MRHKLELGLKEEKQETRRYLTAEGESVSRCRIRDVMKGAAWVLKDG